MTELPLAHRRIVLTRPPGQSDSLAANLRLAGAEVLLHPAIVIAPPADAGALREAQAHLASFDFAAFVSSNAVAHGLAGVPTLPKTLVCLAPGPGTAKALRAAGATSVLSPAERFDSEGLLALPELQELAGRRVIIFRGDGGRELLTEGLRARGATVELVSCYRRLPPVEEMPALARTLLGTAPDALVITSSEGLDNLLAGLPKPAAEVLRRTTLFVPHARIASHARAAGCAKLILTPGADAGLVAGIVHHFEDSRTDV